VVVILRDLIQLYVVVLIARVLLGWLPGAADGPLAPVDRVLRLLTEPVLAPVRRVVPPVRMGGGGLDLSPLIVLLVLEVVASRL
jgi:YggT family protein